MKCIFAYVLVRAVRMLLGFGGGGDDKTDDDMESFVLLDVVEC